MRPCDFLALILLHFFTTVSDVYTTLLHWIVFIELLNVVKHLHKWNCFKTGYDA